MNEVVQRDPANEEHWNEFASHWLIRPDSIYLNHGSFGPPPEPVKQLKRKYTDELDSQPMDFYTRRLESMLLKTRQEVADFVGTDYGNLVLVENATFGMNVLAESFPLNPGDQVALNNHEYGAVERIWQRRCKRTGATVCPIQLPDRIESNEQIVDCFVKQIDESVKLLVISHVTSATAIVMPIKQIIEALSGSGVAVAIDGPHAPMQIELNIDGLGCDFYAASCHKWLCAGLGSGFLAVSPNWHSIMEPLLKSWGVQMPALPQSWDEEFYWSGTRNPAAYLSIPHAIEFMRDQIGIENFRARSRYLATTAETMFKEEFGTEPIARREQGHYASMAHVPLPPGKDFSTLQKMLWSEYQIEVPIIDFEDKWYLRVSCHIYNNLKQIKTLLSAVRKFLV